MRTSLFSPATALALAAILFALGGSAFAVGEKASPFQRRCESGTVRGVASVSEAAVSGEKPFPTWFSGAARLFDHRFNCAGGPVLARKLATGVFDVKFAGNSGRVILASTLGSTAGVVGWSRNSDGSFRIQTSVGTESGRRLVDSPFLLILF